MNTLAAPEQITKEQIENTSLDKTLWARSTLPTIRNINLESESLKINTDFDESIFSFKSDPFFRSQINLLYEKLKDYPNSTIILNNLGNTYLAHGNTKKARNFFLQAFKSDKYYLESARNLARTYLLDKKPIKAKEIFEHIINNIVNEPSVIHELSLVLIILKDYPYAIRLLESIEPSYKKYFEILNTLGLINLILKKYEEAEFYFKKSIKINSEYVYAYNNLGVTYMNLKNNEEAFTYLNKALSMDVNYVDPYLNIFSVYIINKDYDNARSIMEKGQELKETNHEVIFKYAWILTYYEEYDKAIEKYNEVLNILPNNAPTLNNIGHCYVKKGLLNKGIKYFEKALYVKKDYELAKRNLLLTLNGSGNNKRALELAESILQNKPDYAPALFVISDKYIRDRNYDKAQELLIKAYNQNPQLIGIYVNLSFILIEIRQDYEEAIAVLEKAFSLGINSPLLANNFIVAYLMLNKVNEAKEMLGYITEKLPVYLMTKSLLKLKERKLKEAEKLYEDALQIAPEAFKPKIEQRWYLNLADFFLTKGEINRPKIYLNQAINVEQGFDYIKDRAKQKIENLK